MKTKNPTRIQLYKDHSTATDQEQKKERF